jgi:hypothetical protein
MGLRITSNGNIRSSNSGVRCTNWDNSYTKNMMLSFSLTTVAKQRMNSTTNATASLNFINNYIYDDVYDAKYAPLYELVMRFGARELVQRSDRSIDHLATPELLYAIAHNLDMLSIAGEAIETIPPTFEAARIIKHQAVAIDDFIDSYIREDYQVDTITIENTPHLLKEIACNIVRWHLYLDGGLEEQHIIQRRYDDAIKKLELIRSGQLNLSAKRIAKVFFNDSRKHWGF